MPSRSAMSAAHENAALSRKVSKSGDTARRRSVIAAVSAPHRLVVLVGCLRAFGQDRPQLVVEVERLAGPNEARETAARPCPRTRGRRARSGCRRRRAPWLERDPCGAGADRREARDVVRGAFGEDGDRAALAQLGLRIFEGTTVCCACSAVDLPMDRDHTRQRQKGPDEDHLPERRLRQEPRESAERRDDEHGIREPVEVVRDDERRPSGVEPIEAGRLDLSVKAPCRDLRDAQDELIKDPPDHAWSVRRTPGRKMGSAPPLDSMLPTPARRRTPPRRTGRAPRARRRRRSDPVPCGPRGRGHGATRTSGT